jgi:hypothetical protein
MTAPADNTPASIIADAYFDAGITQVGQSSDSEQIALGMRKLTDLINLWQVRPGLKLWLNVDTAVPLVEGQATYTFKPSGDVDMTKPLRVLQGYNLDSSNIRRPLTVLAWEEYLRLSQVTGNNGQINSYFVNKKQSELAVSFWLTPDATAATGTAHVLLQTQVTNFTNVTEEMNFPLEWRIALRWGLADEISTGQPQAIMDRCQQRAAMYLQVLEDWDVEDAPTRITPDQRAGMSTGSFR